MTFYYYEFEEDGGYDGMSSALLVYDAHAACQVCKVDVADFDDGREPDFRTCENANWDWRHRRDPVAEQFAAMLCQRLNA